MNELIVVCVLYGCFASSWDTVTVSRKEEERKFDDSSLQRINLGAKDKIGPESLRFVGF